MKQFRMPDEKLETKAIIKQFLKLLTGKEPKKDIRELAKEMEEKMKKY